MNRFEEFDDPFDLRYPNKCRTITLVPDLTPHLLESWSRILPTLLATPELFHQRLSRRSLPTLTRPPRPWCLSLRASDRRIPDSALSPLPPDSPFILHHSEFSISSHPPHQITITPKLLLSLTNLVSIPRPGLDAAEVATLLGRHPSSLITSRLQNKFSTHHVPGLSGKHGRPIPILRHPALLDPAARSPTAAPDPHFPSIWNYRTPILPNNFSQSLICIPFYRPVTFLNPHYVSDRPSRKLPPPVPDYVWYKWKGDEYIGYDWRNPRAAAAHHRHQRKLASARAANKRQRAKTPGRSTGSLLFAGYRFLCPACHRPVSILYLPLPSINLYAMLADFRMPAHVRRELEDNPSSDAFPTFACYKCHRVRFISPIDRNFWNTLITYLSRGLLYGRDVPRPAEFRPETTINRATDGAGPCRSGADEVREHLRKRPYRPQTNRPAPRRAMVLRRILNGWSPRKIARDMQISLRAVLNHIHTLCAHEQVNDRHALAKKLNSPHPQPLNQVDRANERRKKLLPLLLQGLPYKQLMKELSVDFSTLNRDTQHLYRQHKVKGYGPHARRHLAQKLGAPLPPLPSDNLRSQIRHLRDQGFTWKQIAKEMGMTFSAVDYHAKRIRRELNRSSPSVPA
jgi:DNA-binding NarL/FixJ family response regulator